MEFILGILWLVRNRLKIYERLSNKISSQVLEKGFSFIRCGFMRRVSLVHRLLWRNRQLVDPHTATCVNSDQHWPVQRKTTQTRIQQK